MAEGAVKAVKDLQVPLHDTELALPEMPAERLKETLVGDSAKILVDEVAASALHPGIRSLPNELLDNIFSHLDTTAPSASRKLSNEPSFDLTSEKEASLKAVSMVCHKWRSVVMPRLFKHTRLIISQPLVPTPILRSEEQPLFNFVRLHSLRAAISSFTLCIVNLRILAGDDDYRENDFSSFWTEVFEVLDPADLTIVTSPQILGALTCCHVYSGDAWSYDMPYHYLQLRVQTETTRLFKPSKESELAPDTPQPPPIVPARHSTLFEIRPWAGLLLNEGSFIKSYKTYEFFQKEPPSILDDLVGSESRWADSNHQPVRPMIPKTIRDLSYIAMFPVSTHFGKLTQKCPRLERMYTQFVPRSDVFSDVEQMKHLEVNDLWMERNSCYALIMRELFNSPPSGNFVLLRIFESGDQADVDAWEMAVEYVKRSGGGWRIERQGVFVKDMKLEEEEKKRRKDESGDSSEEEPHSLLSVTGT